MTRPTRPRVLITALVLLPLAALLFGMTATSLGGSDSSSAGLPSLTLLIALLTIRFNWARMTTVALLLLLTILWLPGALEHLSSDSMTQQNAAIYVLIATALSAAGATLAFHTRSNTYYEQAAAWRQDRRSVPK